MASLTAVYGSCVSGCDKVHEVFSAIGESVILAAWGISLLGSKKIMTTGDEPSIGGDKRIDTTGAEPTLGGEAAILHLVEMLGHTSRRVRLQAAYKLGELGDDRVVDPLLAALVDDNSVVRLYAAMALGKHGSVRAVEPLIRTLRDEQVLTVVAQAAIALGKLGDRRAIEPLLTIITEERAVWAAADALGRLGDRQAVEPLIEVLNNYSRYGRQSHLTRVKAAIALGKLGDGRAVEVLKNALYVVERETADLPEIEDELRSMGFHYFQLSRACKKALQQIGTPEALAAIEDLPFQEIEP